MTRPNLALAALIAALHFARLALLGKENKRAAIQLIDRALERTEKE